LCATFKLTQHKEHKVKKEKKRKKISRQKEPYGTRTISKQLHMKRGKAAQGESEPLYLVWLSCGIVSVKLSNENCYHSLIILLSHKPLNRFGYMKTKVLTHM